jgi:hypothetical protein
MKMHDQNHMVSFVWSHDIVNDTIIYIASQQGEKS